MRLWLTLAQPVQTGHKVLVAHNGQAEEGEYRHQDVQDEAAVLSRPFVHQRLRKLLDGWRRAIVALGSPGGHSAMYGRGWCCIWQNITSLEGRRGA